MISTGRAYNALTGQELKQAILNEVSRALDNAGFDSPAMTYPQCSWSWTLNIFQKDAQGEPVSDVPERKIEAGTPTAGSKLMSVLGGGSKRYKNNPPSPTEVREEEGLPLPEL